ncbi:MAG: Fe-S cluster assembly transcriptional regulator IscR [Usitatibacter sp.]|jgi:Rrf2 family iron-sulfur cluster assembly transcriptional regulator
MRLSTKGRFAVTAMLDLALHSAEGPVTLAGISGRQKISLSYLEQLFGKLRRNELVESVRGPGGGYHLARDASKLTVADIVSAVEETLDSTQCAGRENCHDNHRCMTHELWEELNTTVYGFLSGVTLAQLVEKQRTKPVSLVRNHSRPRDGHPITA